MATQPVRVHFFPWTAPQVTQSRGIPTCPHAAGPQPKCGDRRELVRFRWSLRNKRARRAHVTGLDSNALVGFVAVVVSIFLTGCRREAPAMAAPPPPVVSVTRPVIHPVQNYYDYNGNLDAVEMVEVTARVEGILKEVTFTEGDEVKPGDLLFKIDPREYAAAVKRAEADKRKASVELKRTQSEEARASRFRVSGAISEEDFEQRVAARETAEATVMQTEAALEAGKLELEYTEIHSPIAGQISRTRVTPGNLVGPMDNSLLTTIVSMDPLYIYFDAPERDLVEYQQALQSGKADDVIEDSIRVEIGVSTEQGYPHVGKIDFRENRVDVGTGTVRIRGRIPNPKVPPGNARALYPGLFARVRVPDGEPKDLPAIPEDALMSGQEGHYVYVLAEGNVIQKRTVKVGPAVWKAQVVGDQQRPWSLVVTSGPPNSKADSKANQEKAAADATVLVPSVVAIESGLAVEDSVVFNGLTKARPGAPVAPESWELRPPRESAKTP
jgi:membrane fusion protein, multidrug efflux system